MRPCISDIILFMSISHVFDMSVYLYVIYNLSGFGAPYSFIHEVSLNFQNNVINYSLTLIRTPYLMYYIVKI